MNDSELDATYTLLCRTLTDVGESNAQAYLARFALLAALEIGERAVVQRLIEEARDGLAP